jgi:hypothetical protein
MDSENWWAATHAEPARLQQAEAIPRKDLNRGIGGVVLKAYVS